MRYNKNRGINKLFVETKTKTKLLKKMGEAIRDFSMIEDGDKVMVCLSGGKDSYTMLDLLLDVQKRAPVKFEILLLISTRNSPIFPNIFCRIIWKRSALIIESSKKTLIQSSRASFPKAKPFARFVRG